jgi:hypothetical protein
MPDLSFKVENVQPVTFAAVPLLSFRLCVTNANPHQLIHSIALRCQIQIESPRRRYSGQEQEKLVDLFGDPQRWNRTLRSLLWTHTSTTVAAFEQSATVELPVPCTFDFNVASTKYFAGLDEGEVPLTLLFSGTVFFDDDGSLHVEQIAWDKEATYRLPVKTWQAMMEHYYPNQASFFLRRDVFDRLRQYKSEHCIPTFEQTLEALLAAPTHVGTDEVRVEGSLPS